MQLRVWWIPQVPMSPFYVPVRSVEEAALVTDTLALYDMFQFENGVKPDYCNTGGLQCFDETEGEWCDWYDEKTGDDYDEYCCNKGLGRAAEIREAAKTAANTASTQAQSGQRA